MELQGRKMEHLFAYGTLMCEDIMLEVSGYAGTALPAILKGYRRYRIQGESYPGIVRDPKSDVNGVVYKDVPDSAWECLDKFEGEMYTRERVLINLSADEPLNAVAYVIKKDYRDYLIATEWSFSEFLKKDKTEFQRSYSGLKTHRY
jgi:gamma-glutamylcyclotransferase (GGCT)/AIG2-like uncharacterized protein YtfP